MARTLTMTFFILTLFSLPSQGQTDFRVMSYNVENLFDTKDDPLTAAALPLLHDTRTRHARD